MKLGNRIIIGFVMVVLMSMILLTASLYVLYQYQNKRSHPPEINGQAVSEGEFQQETSGTEEDEYEITVSEPSGLRNPFKLNLMMRDLLLVIAIVLVFTSIVMGFWIYSGISVPVNRLRTAAKNIRDGNLDFQIECDGKGEFAELSQDFEEMRLRLKESSDEKIYLDKVNKELISNISHDLKTPLTAIKGYVEGIMDGVADTPEKSTGI